MWPTRLGPTPPSTLCEFRGPALAAFPPGLLQLLWHPLAMHGMRECCTLLWPPCPDSLLPLFFSSLFAAAGATARLSPLPKCPSGFWQWEALALCLVSPAGTPANCSDALTPLLSCHAAGPDPGACRAPAAACPCRAGLATFGYKIMRLLGVKMTRLTNSRGAPTCASPVSFSACSGCHR